MSSFNRRQFLKFTGRSSTALGFLSTPFLSIFLNACAQVPYLNKILPFTPLKPTDKDDLVLAPGFQYKTLISWGEKINDQDFFGYNNDFTCFIPLKNRDDEGLLWVNHEYPSELYVSGYNKKSGKKKTKAQVEKEQESVGGSVLHIRKKRGRWSLIKESSYNRRITGKSKIPFSRGEKVMGQNHSIGTIANCAGGLTPWNTFLTCEENTHKFYGDLSFDQQGQRHIKKGKYQWDSQFNYPPEHYGWVVEVNPFTGQAQKHISMGRFAHESATVAPMKGKKPRLVVYSGDDARDEHIYKFIADSSNSLKSGTLYVADLELGRWLPISREKSPALRKAFKSDLEMFIRTREAAKILGATPLDRPEDIEIDTLTGHVYVTLTNNAKKGNFYGSILKIVETGDNHASLTFKSETFLSGGTKSGFACPDNMVFDKKGNLWMTSDISEKAIKNKEYRPFKSNGLFYIPLRGPLAGEVYQVASAPVDAELTGPCFSRDGKTLFLSVQHPGARTKDLNKPTSTWPTGKTPKPSVVTIEGPALDKLTS